MAARTPLEMLQDESCCSICLGIFQDPVSIHCGHSFCRSCITETWEGLTTNFSCPQCRETVSWKRLRPNWELSNMIEAAKRLNLQRDRDVEGENFCNEHQEPLKLFCQDDKRLICVVCDRSKVHRDHSVVPMDEAVQECKVRGLWVSAKQKIVTTYRKLHEFLEKQESSLLAQLEQLDTEIRKAHEEILQRLLEETTRLGTLIGEMERTYQQPDWQLLKVRAQAFQSGWEGSPCAWSPALPCLPQPAPRGTSLEEKVLFPPKSAAMSLTLSPPPAQMTLDPETANARLYLSEDCKLVRWNICEQDLPSNSKRFKVEDCVLGSRGFTSGWHRWDVEVHREGFWAIGVAKESLPRDRVLSLNPNEGIWALRHILNGYQALTSPDVTPLTLRRVPKWIRICLDYEEGRVVFFDAESKERIFAFPPASFQGERVFPWFMVMAGEKPTPLVFTPFSLLLPPSRESPSGTGRAMG
uniref:Zinc finger protein RFP-like n=1 Tax=Calidris pygmaea TaxID=425635 RepID=A0A8C3JMQ2_9CHAR